MKRRLFLRGLGGVMLGLPFLESLAPRLTPAQAQAAAPRRFVTFFTCNGVNMDTFWPIGAFGALSDAHFAGRAIQPLAKHKSKLLIPRNMHQSVMGFNWPPGSAATGGNDHEKGMGCKLTGAPLDASTLFASGASIDQFVADKINPDGRAPITAGVLQAGGGGTGSISYRASGQPVTSEVNPRLVFQDLMSIDFGGTGGAEQKNLLVDRRKSVLDLVHGDFERLNKKKLSKSDQKKLDLHFSTVRDLEKQLASGSTGGLACAPLDSARASQIQNADNGVDVHGYAAFKDVGLMQMDLIALALACDHTRVASLQWGSGAGGPVFTWDGLQHLYTHHQLSHGNTHDDDTGSAVAGYLEMLTQIDNWYAKQFAYLLEKLDSYEENDGTLLDQSLVMWISELSHGKDHDFRDLPCVLAGSCGGYFKQGRYENTSKFPDARKVWPPETMDAPHNKLLTTIANATGAGPLEHFGDANFGASGELEMLKA